MKSLIESFYLALQRKDAKAMGLCYHEEVTFQDPAFGTLHGDEAKAMWTMLCANGKDLEIEFGEIEADENRGSGRCEARYTFGKKGRKVHNRIRGEFEFKDGKILRHTDHFDMYQWSRQALGWKGMLLGWTAFFRRSFQKQAKNQLEKFMDEEGIR